MSSVQRTSERFAAALPDEVRAAWCELAGLDAALEHAHAVARPPAPCPAPTLARHVQSLASRLAATTPDLQAIATLDHAGIALADACVDGNADAIACFHRMHLGDIDHAIARVHAAASLAEDVRQIVLAKLLPPGSKLARYSGRGALQNWVRAVTVRETISVLRGSGDDAVAMPDVIDVAASWDLELSYVRSSQREHLRAALRASFDALDPEDRAVLRYRFVDGLTLDQLATVLGVHRATAARWLARLREELLRGTRRRLCDELGLDRAQFDSLVGLVRSNLEITIRGLLHG
jgi:RNA polymerase sigma-70 factor (ECF subfamily)